VIVRERPFALSLPPSVGRSKGVHNSAIIRCIATEQGILKPEWAEELSLVDAREITDQTAILRMSIGLAWEQYYIPTILGPAMNVEDHPKELCVDGIYMSPDGESLDVIFTSGNYYPRTTLHEVKATYKSTNTVGMLENQWLWVAQLKGYCKGMNTRFAVLHVLFICGDYKMPIKPQLRLFDVEFTQDEIDTNWELMVDYKNYREQMQDAAENGA
jgi:hypothetical protein